MAGCLPVRNFYHWGLPDTLGGGKQMGTSVALGGGRPMGFFGLGGVRTGRCQWDRSGSEGGKRNRQMGKGGAYLRKKY